MLALRGRSVGPSASDRVLTQREQEVFAAQKEFKGLYEQELSARLGDLALNVANGGSGKLFARRFARSFAHGSTTASGAGRPTIRQFIAVAAGGGLTILMVRTFERATESQHHLT